MDIQHISVIIGERVETNPELLERLRPTLASRNLKLLERLLQRSGAHSRRLSLPDKSPLQYLSEAYASIAEHGSEIEAVIHCSIARGVIEPSQAAIYAQHLGLHNAQAFDVSEACNGLVRGLQLAYALLRSGQVRGRVLLISNEWFDVPHSPTEACFTADTGADLVTRFAGMTFGGAAALMLLGPSDNDSWRFKWTPDNSIATRCTMALPNFHAFVPTEGLEDDEIPRIGAWEFCSDHRALAQRGGRFPEWFTEEIQARTRASDLLLVHSHSKLFWDRVLEPYDLPLPPLHLFPDYGNLGTATIPVGLAHSYRAGLEEGRGTTYIAAAGGFSGGFLHFEQRAPATVFAAGLAPGPTAKKCA